MRRSITDLDGRPATLGGRHLADLVVQAGAVRNAFDLVRVHSSDNLTPSADNTLHLRTANLGTNPQQNGRHRLFRLDMTVTPTTATPVAATATLTVPAAGSAISQFAWNPGAVSADESVSVLAISDHDPDRPLEPPAPGFASLEALDAFCDANPNAAYRRFEVGP